MQYIYSNQNKTFKNLKKLLLKKHRITQNRIIIEGLRIINHSIKLGIKPEIICYDSISMDKKIRQNENDIILENALFNQISDTISSQGVVAVIKNSDIEKIIKPSSNNLVVVNGVQDPGNLGTIIRTADAFGFDRMILSKNTCDPYSAKSLRSSMGGIFSVTLKIGMQNQDIINFLKKEGYKILVSSLESKNNLKDINLKQKYAIVLGNEGNGVDKEFIEAADYMYKINMRNTAESLNVGVAAGISFYNLSSLA